MSFMSTSPDLKLNQKNKDDFFLDFYDSTNANNLIIVSHKQMQLELMQQEKV